MLSFYPRGSKLSSFLLYGRCFLRYGPYLPYLGMKPEVAHVPSFYPEGRNWGYFCSTGRGFTDMCQCLKLSYLGMKLRYLPKRQKLHIYPVSTPWARNWAYFCSMGRGLRDMGQFSKLPLLSYLGMKLSHWPKCQKLHIYPLSTPKGRNWAYFCSTGSAFRDTGRFSKLPYLGMKLSHWPKCQKLHIYFLSIYPSGVGIELIFVLRAAVSEIEADFQNCHIWAWNLSTGQSSRNCTYTS